MKTTKSSEEQGFQPAAAHKSAASSQVVIQDQRPEVAIQRKLQDQAQAPPVQRKENNTGLPDNLKSGIENLSGLAMDDVRVHRNSSKPAQLNAHAYAQGTDIHLAAGQEKHLPHEAWHVVQQKQGRVKPTRQLKSKVAINDDKGLEREADVMGAKAVAGASPRKRDRLLQNKARLATTQLKGRTEFEGLQGNWTSSSIQDWVLDSNEVGKGHVAERHVDISEVGLIARTQDEHLEAASKFYDSPWAVLAEVLNAHKSEILDWIAGGAKGFSISETIEDLPVFAFEAPNGGKGRFEYALGAKVTIVFNMTNPSVAGAEREYYLVTAFPVVSEHAGKLSRTERLEMKKEQKEAEGKKSKGQRKHEKKKLERMKKTVEKNVFG